MNPAVSLKSEKGDVFMSKQVLRSNAATKTNSRGRNKEALFGVLFASPAILGFLIFILGPMIVSLILSFTNYTVTKPKINFIGFTNYRNLFDGTDPFFYKSLAVTSYYVFLGTPISLIFAFAMAMLLNMDIKARGFFRTVFYLPYIVPAVASAAVWMWLLNPDLGLLNSLLRSLHLPTSQWLYDEKSVIPTLIFIGLWTTGNTIIIFLAGLQGISRHYYEAIDVDGGNSIHKLIYITIPMMTPTVFFNLIMGFTGAFQGFIQPYILTQGGPNNASLFYVFYLWREAFQFARMGSASAMAWVLFVIIMFFTGIVFLTSGKWVYYEGDEK